MRNSSKDALRRGFAGEGSMGLTASFPSPSTDTAVLSLMKHLYNIYKDNARYLHSKIKNKNITSRALCVCGNDGKRDRGEIPDKSGTTDNLSAVPMSADLLAIFAILGVGSVLGGFRLLARLRLGAFARRGRLSAVCSGFGVFHVHSFWGIAPCSDFCLSRVVCRTVCDFILFRAGEFLPHSLARASRPRVPMRFIIKVRRALRLCQQCSAQDHKNKRSRGIPSRGADPRKRRKVSDVQLFGGVSLPSRACVI